MKLTQAHGKARDTVENKYEPAGRRSTTGLSTLGSDINSYNGFGMTPVQVALQVGATDELGHILAQPGVDPLKPSRSGKPTSFFIDVFQQINQGSSPFNEASQATTDAGKAVDHMASHMRKILKDLEPAAPAPQKKAEMEI